MVMKYKYNANNKFRAGYEFNNLQHSTHGVWIRKHTKNYFNLEKKWETLYIVSSIKTALYL